MKNNLIETLMGAIVLIVAGLFFGFAYKTSGAEKTDSYSYQARFNRIDGLFTGADVRMGGVKVGVIKAAAILPESYLVSVSFTVDKTIKLPTDSSAEIASDGLLGGKYLSIVPGGADDFLAEGGQIMHTQSAVNLESLIGQLIFSNKPKENQAAE
jgi:phospholipid/cholesterol/gamma-HCH transport system substrate-binding protein